MKERILYRTGSVSRFEALLRGKQPMKYHIVDKQGHAYLCGCFSAFRIGKEIKYPTGRRRPRSRKGTEYVSRRFVPQHWLKGSDENPTNEQNNEGNTAG